MAATLWRTVATAYDAPFTVTDPRPSLVAPIAFAASASALLLLAGDSVGIRDAGELTTAAWGVDVAHPTGFPLDLVFMRLGMLVPFGDVGFRANVVTAVWMAVACALASQLAHRLAEGVPAWGRFAAATLPPIVMIGSRTIVRAGTAAEVYALSLTASLAGLTLVTHGGARARRMAALFLGLTLCMHTGARPAIGLAWAVLMVAASSPVRAAVASAACGFAGALGVVYLPVAAHARRFIDWGDPQTFARLRDHLTAARIRHAFAHRMLVPWRAPEDLDRVAHVLGADVGAVTLILGVVGALASVRDARRRWIVIAVIVDVTYATLVNPMGVGDRQTLFVAQAGLAILAVAGARMLSAQRAVVFTGLVSMAALFAVWRADPHASARADGWTATDVLGGAGALGAVPPHAIVLCESDDFAGVSLYAQRVEGERPDVVVLPRQHLADPSTWRRGGARLAAIPVTVDRDLRVARLRAIVAYDPARVRWEPGEIDDERLARVRLGTSETPVLATLESPVDARDLHAADWLAPRIAAGDGARALGAALLTAVGRRVAREGIDVAVPLWEQALRWDDENATAWTNLGVARSMAGDLVGAIERTERAVSLNPERVTAWRNLARYRRALGATSAANEADREVRRRGP